MKSSHIALVLLLAAVLLLLAVFGCSSLKPAAEPVLAASPQKYFATVLSVHDGDTFTARVDLGLGVSVTEKFRLDGLDCPELNTAAGKFVRDAVRVKMPVGEPVSLLVTKREKYGRWMAEVFIDGESLNKWLLLTGQAKPYSGGKRDAAAN